MLSDQCHSSAMIHESLQWYKKITNAYMKYFFCTKSSTWKLKSGFFSRKKMKKNNFKYLPKIPVYKLTYSSRWIVQLRRLESRACEWHFQQNWNKHENKKLILTNQLLRMFIIILFKIPFASKCINYYKEFWGKNDTMKFEI